jgi:hypothetical protein
MNGYSSLHFYIQKTNLYNTEFKKMYSAIWKKEADVHLSKTGLKNFFLFSWYWSVFKIISFDVSFIQIG